MMFAWWVLNPSTSSGPLPSTETVAPKFSRLVTLPVLDFWFRRLMPHEGSGLRSGSTEAGGLARSGTCCILAAVSCSLLARLGPRACLAGVRKVQGLHWLGFTACSFTVAVALCAPIRRTPRHAFGIDIVA